jgi:SAM-dependent methyltransferase
MQYIRCDLCGADDTETIYAGSSWRMSAATDWRLQRCRKCGLMYLNPRPSEDEISSYYPAEYGPFRPAIEDERHALMRWMRRRKLIRRRRLVERFSGRTGGRILDVGCATGIFLHEMASAGWQATGVEPVTRAAAYARDRFGLDVFSGMLDQAPFERGAFDVVTFWDVLEHTFCPAQELERAARLLAPGGLVAINVPNWRSADRWLFGPYWIGFDPPRHLYVFTQCTLTALLRNAGFRPLSWICFMPAYFSFAVSLDRWLTSEAPRMAGLIRRLLNLPGARLPFEPAFAVLAHLRRSGVISVFARKESGINDDNIQHAR